MEDYYKILDIPASASVSEIKRAFRKKAKALHPDIPHNGTEKGVQKTNEQALRNLIRAYEALIDSKRKEPYDFFYEKNQSKQASSFDYRAWLQGQSDMKSRVYLIVFDLFHNAETQAVQEFLRLRAIQPHFHFAEYFNREDFMDCGFVLAEELFFREEYYESFLLLERIIAEEQRKAYFRHFFPEVLMLARRLLCEKIIHALADDLILDCCETALQFGLSKTDKAVILRAMAEIYYRIGDPANGIRCMQEAVRLHPKIRKRLIVGA